MPIYLPIFSEISTEIYLEWGLCCHHFDFGDKGKKSFQQAKGKRCLEMNTKDLIAVLMFHVLV